MVDITVKDWCELFLTCFQSPVLQRRCVKDFYFYRRLFLRSPRPQAFTFEIGTYLSATRIQVNYCPYQHHHYRLIVNIIHCDSAGTYNGSSTYLSFGYDFLNKKLMLFPVVGSCWAKVETVKRLRQQLPTFCSEASTMLDPFLQLFRHRWGHSRALRMFTKSYRLYPFYDVLQVPILFGVVASRRFLTIVNTDATTLNIVRPTMLGFVGSFCT